MRGDLVFRALVDLRAGEELFHSYAPILVGHTHTHTHTHARTHTHTHGMMSADGEFPGPNNGRRHPDYIILFI